MRITDDELTTILGALRQRAQQLELFIEENPDHAATELLTRQVEDYKALAHELEVRAGRTAWLPTVNPHRKGSDGWEAHLKLRQTTCFPRECAPGCPHDGAWT